MNEEKDTTFGSRYREVRNNEGYVGKLGFHCMTSRENLELLELLS